MLWYHRRMQVPSMDASSKTISYQSRPLLLIVDDNPTNIELLKAQLKKLPYELITADNGQTALDLIRSNPPDLILLDLMMPGMSGYEVCQIIKKDPQTHLIPVIIITALRELTDKIKAMELGADDFLMKPFNKLELITRIKSLIRLKQLYDDLESSENIVFTLAEALEAKDVYTRGHSDRVARYSIMLAKALGLSEYEIDCLHRGALLHDIGKVGIKDSILNKDSRLTKEEMAHIHSHPERGYEICKKLKSFKKLLPIIRSHHEHHDGRGHPDGLQGEEIPLLARICSIADAFDAMISDRPYRKGIQIYQAVDIFTREMDSGQWDPELLKVFISLIEKEAPTIETTINHRL